MESGDELGRLAVRVKAMADRQRESTAQLRDESERKHRSIFENELEGIFQLDRRGCLTEANPAMASWSAEVMSAVNTHERRLFPLAQSDALFEILASKGEIAGLELQLSPAHQRADSSAAQLARGV